jgi:membrane fusion protein, heavy metal efflux system
MRFILFSTVLILTAAQAVFAAGDIDMNAQQIKALGIETAILPKAGNGELAGMPAQVVIPANQLLVVSAPLPAMVEQTLAGVGDHVRKGQLLARLQSPALAEMQRGYLQASTQEKLAHDNFTRDEQLWKEGIIAESRYRATLSQLTEAAAALAEKRQMLMLAGMNDNAITQLQNGGNLGSLLPVVSPIAGVIMEKWVGAGQRVESAAPLFNVAKLNPLGLEIQAPLASTLNVREGAEVSIPAYGAKGKITAIGHGLSDSNQTVLMRALISKGTEKLRPGQHVDVSIATTSGKGKQWSVPNAAIARVGEQSVIFVETPGGFRSETVNILHEGVQQTVVSGNFSGKEKIAVRGVTSLKAKLMGVGAE